MLGGKVHLEQFALQPEQHQAQLAVTLSESYASALKNSHSELPALLWSA